MRILLLSMYEMAVATLKRKAKGEFDEPLDKVADGRINALQGESLQSRTSLCFVPRIVDKGSGFCKGLHFESIGRGI
jgi:hypothetical protein